MSDEIKDDYEMSDDESTIKEYEEQQREYLEKWCSDPKFLIWLHTRSIYNLTRLYKPSASRLRMFIDKLQTHLRELNSLNSDVMIWKNQFTKIIYSKFDPLTKIKWDETFRDVNQKNIDVSTLMVFLNRTCQEYETLNLEPEDDEDTDG